MQGHCQRETPRSAENRLPEPSLHAQGIKGAVMQGPYYCFNRCWIGKGRGHIVTDSPTNNERGRLLRAAGGYGLSDGLGKVQRSMPGYHNVQRATRHQQAAGRVKHSTRGCDKDIVVRQAVAMNKVRRCAHLRFFLKLVEI